MKIEIDEPISLTAINYVLQASSENKIYNTGGFGPKNYNSLLRRMISGRDGKIAEMIIPQLLRNKGYNVYLEAKTYQEIDRFDLKIRKDPNPKWIYIDIKTSNQHHPYIQINADQEKNDIHGYLSCTIEKAKIDAYPKFLVVNGIIRKKEAINIKYLIPYGEMTPFNIPNKFPNGSYFIPHEKLSKIDSLFDF